VGPAATEHGPPVGFQKLATHGEQRFHAARSYLLIRPLELVDA